MARGDKFYCDAQNCIFGHFYETGDGWNEPRVLDFECDCPDTRYDDSEFTENKDNELCPGFSAREVMDNVNDR